MKSLNRTLSLVLVLAMVFGLMGIASATTFTDTATVQYKEAVDVVTGIGAINGLPNGSFNPTGTITREDAAKMVCYAILGASIAKTLTVSTSSFSDVAATRWSAPYIAYLVSQGIINGNGDGTFAPTGNVTGYQIAKMMLCAAGYGKQGEFTGNSWELNVAVTANKNGVFTGTKATSFSVAATREEAALYVFNALTKVKTVSYSKLFDEYNIVPNGTSLAHSSSDINGDFCMQIAESIYSGLKLFTVDLDGSTAHYWVLDGKTISGFYTSATVLVSSNNGTALSLLTSSSSAKYIGYVPSTTPALAYFLNGTVSDANAIGTESVKNGVVVKFVDTNDDGKYENVSATNNTVATVSADPTITTSGTVTYVTVPGITGLSKVESTKVFGYEGLAKDDYVMWHATAGNYFLTKCTSFTGTVNATSALAGVVVVNGKQYKISGINSACVMSDFVALAGIAGTTFYLDEGGFICAVDGATTAVNLTNTTYVLETSAPYSSFNGLKAKLLMSDGSVVTAAIAKIGTEVVSGTNGTIPTDTYYTFVKNTDGTYNLTSIAASKITMSADNYLANDVIFDASTSADFFAYNHAGTKSGKLATSSTVFVVENSDGTYTVYTGIANAPKVVSSGTTAQAAVLGDTSGFAVLAVVRTAITTSSVSGGSYVFCTLPAATVVMGTDTYNTYLSPVVNGEIKASINATVDAAIVNPAPYAALTTQMVPGVLYSVTSYSNGRISAATYVANANTNLLFAPVTGIDDFSVSGNTVVYKNNGAVTGSFVASDTCKVYIYDNVTDPNLPTITASSLAEVNSLSTQSYTIEGYKTSSSDSKIATLIVKLGANVDTTATVTAVDTVLPANALAFTMVTDTYTSSTVAPNNKSYAVTITADPNAVITYSATSGGTYVASSGTQTVAVTTTDVTVYFKVTVGGVTRTITVVIDATV